MHNLGIFVYFILDQIYRYGIYWEYVVSAKLSKLCVKAHNSIILANIQDFLSKSNSSLYYLQDCDIFYFKKNQQFLSKSTRNLGNRFFIFLFYRFFLQQVSVGGRNKTKNKIHSDHFQLENGPNEFPSILIQLENGPNEFYLTN